MLPSHIVVLLAHSVESRWICSVGGNIYHDLCNVRCLGRWTFRNVINRLVARHSASEYIWLRIFHIWMEAGSGPRRGDGTESNEGEKCFSHQALVFLRYSRVRSLYVATDIRRSLD